MLFELAKLPDHLPLEVPKHRLARLFKNHRDAPPGARFDELIGIDEIKAKLGGQYSANTGLARAHESDQSEIA